MRRIAAALALSAALAAGPAIGQSAAPGGSLGADLDPTSTQGDLGRVIHRVSPDMKEMAEIVDAMGMKQELREVGGKTALVAQMAMPGLPRPLSVIIQTLGCNDLGCGMLQLQAAMGQSGLSEEEVGAWNAKTSLVFAVRVPSSGVVALRRPVLVTGGVTAGNLRAEMTLFTQEMLRFIRAVQEKKKQAQ